MTVDSFNAKCITCANRFYSSLSACAPVNPNCDAYNTNNGLCLSCKSGLTIQSNGSCINAPQTQSTQLPPILPTKIEPTNT